MTLQKIGFVALTTVAAAAFVLGTTGTSDAAKRKAKAAATSPTCWMSSGPVCATKGGKRFTYVSACYAANDGAMGASKGACKVSKGGKKKMAAKKPADAKAAAKPAAKKDEKKK